MALNPLPTSEAELLALAAQLERSKRRPELAEVLGALVAAAPTKTAYAKRLGWLWLDLKHPAAARAIFEPMAARPGPDRWEATGAMAPVLAADGKHDEAVAQFQKAFERGVRLPGMLTTLLKALNKAGRYDLGLQAIEEWVKTGPPDPGLLLLHARQLSHVGRFADALETLNRVIAAYPSLQGQEEFQAELLAQGERPKEAMEILSRLLRRSFERPDLHALLSTLMRKAYSDEEAVAVMQAAVERDPGDATAWYHLCELQQRRGLWSEAGKAAEVCARLQPASTLAAGAAARCAVLLGKYQDATPIHQAIWQAAEKAIASPQFHAPPVRKDVALNPVLYLPVEIVGRDFFTRLLIARHALALGFTAVILPHTAIKLHAAELPPGVILHKSLNAFDLEFFESAVAAGHVVTAIDEEGFGWIGDFRSIMRGTDPRCYAACDVVFVPGENYLRQILQKHPHVKDKLVASGNPRTDILAPAFRQLHATEAAMARDQHGPHLLLATNFGLWNAAYDPYSSICKLALTAPGPAFAGDDRQWLVECYKSAQVCEMENMAALRAALEPLATAFSNHKIVVRPHPVENPATWEHITSKMENVVVDAARSFAGQALAADAVIHLDGCGTGLEALLLERPTVCLAPVDGLLDPSLALASKLSPRARDAASLIELVEKALAEGERPATPAQMQLVDQHLTRPAEGVAATIARHLTELFKRKGGHDPAQRKDDAHPNLRRALEVVGQRMKRGEIKEAHTFSVKRIGVDESHIRNTLAALGACLGRDGEARVERVAAGYFILD
jgi:surface carbohydrate biosynthesis protein